jgi:succinate dehydrogenase/fumarate reductase flavoprotein subunit
MDKGLDRRSFLKGAGVCGGLLATAALVGCSNDEPTQANAGALAGGPETWDLEADVVIVGFGYAGIGAARAAQEAGCSAIIVEKMPEADAGGASSCNGGLFLLSTAESLETASFGDWEAARCEDVAAKVVKANDWVSTFATDLIEMPYKGNTVLISPIMDGHSIYVQAKEDAKQLSNVSIEYETPVTRLVVDKQTGDVLGVAAEKNGSEIFIKGKKGTVIATGGYEENRELFNALHFKKFNYTTSAGPARTGDGLLMAAGLGAKVGNLQLGIEWNCYSLKKASEDAGTSVWLADMLTGGGAIFVNSQGKRFEDETRTLNHAKSTLPMYAFDGDSTDRGHMVGYPNQPTWAVWDSALVEKAPIANVTYKMTWMMTHGFDWGTDNLAHVDKGWLTRADTLEELAAQMQSKNMWDEDVVVDAAALAETVGRYNGFAQAGADADFNRPAEAMFALTQPPYYAAEILPAVLYTINGLVIDRYSQVLNWQDQPIPRLYAAGDVSQGTNTAITMLGCYAEGAIAVEQISQLEPWDA